MENCFMILARVLGSLIKAFSVYTESLVFNKISPRNL